MNIYQIGGTPDWVCANTKKEAKTIYREFLKDKIMDDEIDDEIKYNPPTKLTKKELKHCIYRDQEKIEDRTFEEELKNRTKAEMFAFGE